MKSELDIIGDLSERFERLGIPYIQKFFEDRPEIVALYVFGSFATERERKGSDLDLAVMVREKMEGETRLNLETQLSNVLGCDVDLVVFGQVSPLLQHQVLKYGRLIYEADSAQRIRQEVFARSTYLDTAFLYKELR